MGHARFNTYQMITDRIINSLQQGEIPWRKPWRGGFVFPRNLASKKLYRGINVFLLGTQGYESPYWVTFNQCKALGGHVNKGEKASPVIFWKTGQYEAEGDDGEVESRKSFLLRYYNVFNVEQTTLAVAARQLQAEEPREIKSCEEVVAGYLGKPEIKNGRTYRAAYSPQLDIVQMPTRKQFLSPEHYYATLFHELTHSTGHAKRLNRELDCNFGSESYSKEELIAECGSAYLCGITGIDKPELETNTSAYIQNWIKVLQNDHKLVVKAAAAAQTAVDLILGVSEKKAVESESEESADLVVA